MQILQEAPPKPEGGWKSVERRATPRDLLLQQSWRNKQTEAMINCRARASELGLLDTIKVVAAEYNYDGSRLAFLFSTEQEEKVDLKSLRKDMSDIYPNTHIEMRQIGPRDVAKLIGGMGACGIETRCCSKFLTDFSPISIKMAKEQGISLTPDEITGMCGRLRCCLIYEYEQYVEARKTLPKRNKRVVTPKGEGKVIDVQPMSDRVTVLIEVPNERPQHLTFGREEIEPWDELEALRRKSEAPATVTKAAVVPVAKQRTIKMPEQTNSWETKQKILVILAHPDDPEFFVAPHSPSGHVKVTAFNIFY